MAIETMKRLGFTPTEIKVYDEITKIGRTTIGPVIKRTGLHRGTVYNAITSLVHRGILLVSESNGVRHYKIAPLTIFKTILDEKKKQIEEDEEWLDKMLKEVSHVSEEDNENEVEVSYGLDSFKDHFFKMFDECALRKMEYLFMGRGGEMMEAIGEQLYKYTQKRKKELGVSCRVILDRETKKEKYNRFVQGNVRYAESKKQGPLNMWVYGDSVMLVLFTTKPLTTIIIKNALVAKAFGNYFELLWEKIEG